MLVPGCISSQMPSSRSSSICSCHSSSVSPRTRRASVPSAFSEDQLGWETTYDAEFVALTQLQADVFVTSEGDLARAVSGLVETATIDALRTG